MALSDIPQELRQLNQWINWKYEEIDGKQTKIPLRSIDGKKASVTDPRDWTDFFSANAAIQYCAGIGFVFTADDPYCGLDFDNKSNDAAVNIYIRETVQKIASYAEITPSGFGLHSIVKAKLPGNGRRRGALEIYDTKRFFTFTGNVYLNAPIAERQSEVVELWQSIGPAQTVETIATGNDAEIYTDDEILAKAKEAVNGEKFARLFSGDWESDYGDKSQSEADFALINILAFYSRNLTQTIRIFRASGLGQRQKAQRGSYVSLMARRAFDRMPATVSTVTGSGPWFDARVIAPWAPSLAQGAALGAAIGIAHTPAPKEASLSLPPVASLPPIPGLVGKLMAHCWHRSTYPVAEVAIASALASMALLAGRTYRIGSNGLSLYILVMAKTSIGKSFAYQAQHAWQNALIRRYQNPTGGGQYKQRCEYLEGMITGKIGSASGVAQHVVRHPNSLCQYDEFVNKMKEIAHPRANPNDLAIQGELLSLTDNSQPGAIYREKSYSQRGGKEKLPPVISPAFTLLGTGTPEGFYNDLGNGMLEGGFLPRFIIMEYEGTLPEENENVVTEIDSGMLDEIALHFNRAFDLNAVITGDINQIINVEADKFASVKLTEWKRLCETAVRHAHGEGQPTAGLWSRAIQHVYKIAALIAIGVNPHKPVILSEYVYYARLIVEPGIHRIVGKLQTGEVGQGDSRCEAEVRNYVRRVRSQGLGFVEAYPGFSREIAQTAYLQIGPMKWFVTKRGAFKSHKLGESRGFDETINAMITGGEFERKDFAIINGRKVKALLPLF
jgi:hypothetical protein